MQLARNYYAIRLNICTEANAQRDEVHFVSHIFLWCVAHSLRFASQTFARSQFVMYDDSRNTQHLYRNSRHYDFHTCTGHRRVQRYRWSFCVALCVGGVAAVVRTHTHKHTRSVCCCCRCLSAANKTVKENYTLAGMEETNANSGMFVHCEFIAISACGNFVISHFVLIWTSRALADPNVLECVLCACPRVFLCAIVSETNNVALHTLTHSHKHG